MDFSNFASQPKQGSSTGWNDADVVSFLQACKAAHVRVTYAGISNLKLPGERPRLNRGRHGAGIVKSLPLDVQPIVCRSTGTYHEKAGQAFQAIEGYPEAFTGTDAEGNAVTGIAALVTWDVIPQDKVLEAFEAFKAGQTQE